MMPENLKPQMLIVGDSHVCYLQDAVASGLLAPLDVAYFMLARDPVEARNGIDTAAAIGQFRNFLADRNRDSVVVIQLGDVPRGKAASPRAKKNKVAIVDPATRLRTAILSFVEELKTTGFKHIIIAGAVPPTSDTAETGETAKPAGTVQTEQTARVRNYNQGLEQGVRQRGLHYVDVSADIIDPETGVVGHLYQHTEPANHHLDSRRGPGLWAGHVYPLAAKLLLPPAPLQSWKPVRDFSYIKAGKAPAHVLASDQIAAITKQSSLTARFHGTFDHHHFISEARVDGRPINPLLRLIHENSWRVVI